MKKDYINISIIITIFLGIVIFLVGKDYVYGSTLDWSVQHWAFPEYFRNLFYETKSLLPNFAFNIGGGQNIYYFSYYGLLSPIILISYLLPFIPMPYYIMGSSIVVIIVSIILMYKWLYNRFNSDISFISTMLFMLSGPLIFHSHRHIMFMNYMAFLIMALIGVDKYFEKKRTLLIVSIFLIIMTSYYYSVGSIIAISLYYVYKYLETNEKINFKLFIVDGLKFVLHVFISILMASVILLPTAYVILNGRGNTNVSVDYLSLIIPSFNWSYLMYRSYSLGLTSIIIYSMVNNVICRKKHELFMAIIFGLFMFFPIILYILNGTMYIEAKALIPFIPLGILMIATTLDKLINYEYKKSMLIFLVVASLMIWMMLSKNHEDYAFDFAFTLISLYLLNKYKKFIVVLPIIIIALNNCIKLNVKDKLVAKDQIDYQIQTDNNSTIKSILDNDNSLVRFGTTILPLQEINRVYSDNYYQTTIYSSTNNLYYNNFYFNVMGNEIPNRNGIITPQSRNILFNMYMGVKYIIGKDLDIVGYKPYQSIGDNETYINEDVFPIAYVNQSLMSLDEYKRLVYPYNIEALMTIIIVDKDVDSKYTASIESIKPIYELIASNATVEVNNEVLNINSQTDGKITLKLDKPIEGKVLMLKFDMLYNQACSKGDTWITIAGMTNKLTCKEWKYHNKNYTFNYSISSNSNISTIEMTLGKGKYELGNIEFYTIDYDYLKSINNNFDKFIFDNEFTKGDHIEGNIDVTKKGYFILNIPYDKGFDILLDGKKIKYELVNEAFMGFEINEGTHHIEINYSSPYLNMSKVLSLIGFGLLIFIIYKDKNRFIDN